MKTTLRQQKELVKDIQSTTLIVGVKKLRHWLEAHGYEGSKECQHYSIVRITGNCMSCGISVAEPNTLNADEAIEVLSDKLSRR